MKLRLLSSSFVAASLAVSCGSKTDSNTDASGGQNIANDLTSQNNQLNTSPNVLVNTESGIVIAPVTNSGFRLQQRDLDFLSSDFLSLCQSSNEFPLEIQNTVKGLHNNLGMYFEKDSYSQPTCNPNYNVQNNPFVIANGKLSNTTILNNINQVALDNLYTYRTQFGHGKNSGYQNNSCYDKTFCNTSDIFGKGSVYQGNQGSVFQGTQGGLIKGIDGSIYQGNQGSVFQGTQGGLIKGIDGSIYQGNQGSVFQGNQGSVFQGTQGGLIKGIDGSIYQGNQGSVFQGTQGSVIKGSVLQGAQGSIFQGSQGSVLKGTKGSVCKAQCVSNGKYDINGLYDLNGQYDMNGIFQDTFGY